MRIGFPRFVGNALTLLKITTAVTVTLSLLAVPYRAVQKSNRTQEAPTYSVTEISLSGYEGSCATAVSPNGIVAGYAWNGNSCTADKIPFIWRDGKAAPLVLPSSLKSAVPWSCNSQGEVVGWGTSEDGRTFAIYWRGNSCRVIGSRNGHVGYMGINEKGERVGSVLTLDDPKQVHAFMENGSGLKLIGDFMAMRISDDGTVVGSEPDASGKFHAVTWKDGNITRLPMPQGFSQARGHNIGPDGKVIGAAVDSQNGLAAILWENGAPKRLGAGEGIAVDINRSSDILIMARSEKGGLWPVLWHNNQGVDLNRRIPTDSGWKLLFGYTLNDRGQVVGIGSHDKQLHGFLLSPNR